MIGAEAEVTGSNIPRRRNRSGFWRPSVVFAIIAVSYAAYTAVRPAPEAPPVGPITAQSAVVSEFSGIATVSDGDTLRIGERRIQLDGVFTPQRSVLCGDVNVYRAATDALREATRSAEVACRISNLPAAGEDRARCSVRNRSLNEYMVASGWARDWPRYSNGAYAEAEAQARAAGRGVWGLSCPADLWRGFED